MRIWYFLVNISTHLTVFRWRQNNVITTHLNLKYQNICEIYLQRSTIHWYNGYDPSNNASDHSQGVAHNPLSC